MSPLRKFLDFQINLVESNRFLRPLKPLFSALDTFLYEAPNNTRQAPHIRDAVDLKRWMLLVVIALTPCVLMAIWNTGLQKMVYASGNFQLMDEYLASSYSLSDYFTFVSKDNRYLTILKLGLSAFLPIVFISYAVGGLVEGAFACARRHEIAEGFLVSGILYALILPPTIPYWMAAVGVAVGIIISKELFGGTGMNILNPALTCRAFLFFAFPNKMSGDVWVGTNPTTVSQSLMAMNTQAGKGELDGYSQSSFLSLFNVSPQVQRIHVDAVATNDLGSAVPTYEILSKQFEKWKVLAGKSLELGKLSMDQLQAFVTAPISEGGLGLAGENFKAALDFSSIQYGLGHYHDSTLFFGNHVGCMGETSVLAALLGAGFLLITRIASLRTMIGMSLGVFVTAYLFQWGATHIGVDGGAWNPAKYALPAYKHFLVGGFAFGLVFMATDPVSSPDSPKAHLLYGLIIGIFTVIIRIVNPAYPEGVMLAILFGNVCAPLLDHMIITKFRRSAHVHAI